VENARQVVFRRYRLLGLGRTGCTNHGSGLSGVESSFARLAHDRVLEWGGELVEDRKELALLGVVHLRPDIAVRDFGGVHRTSDVQGRSSFSICAGSMPGHFQSAEKGVTSGKRRHISKDWRKSPAIGSNHNKTAPIQKQFFGAFSMFLFF
jgi:hypothetical protein